MLATGASASAACDALERAGAEEITLLSVVSAPEGIAHLQQLHPEVRIVTASIDEGLNQHAYIVPGLGDFGDRLFGTLARWRRSAAEGDGDPRPQADVAPHGGEVGLQGGTVGRFTSAARR